MNDQVETPQWFIMKLTAFHTSHVTPEERVWVTKRLHDNLKVQSVDWVDDYLKSEGFERIFRVYVTFVTKADGRTQLEDDVVKYCVYSIVQLCDQSKDGFTTLLETPNSIREFALAVTFDYDREVQWKVLSTLTSVAIQGSDYFELVFDALQYLQILNSKERLFEIVTTLISSCKETEFEFRHHALTFLNVMISQTKTNLKRREEMMHDLESLDFKSILSDVEKQQKGAETNPKNSEHFEIMKKSREQLEILKQSFFSYLTLSSGSLSTPTIPTDPNVMFKLISDKLSFDPMAQANFSVILRNILKKLSASDSINWRELMDVSSSSQLLRSTSLERLVLEKRLKSEEEEGEEDLDEKESEVIRELKRKYIKEKSKSEKRKKMLNTLRAERSESIMYLKGIELSLLTAEGIQEPEFRNEITDEIYSITKKVKDVASGLTTPMSPISLTLPQTFKKNEEEEEVKVESEDKDEGSNEEED